MAAAAPFIGPAIGAAGSIIGGIQGKGAAKRQERLAREQMDLIRPLLQAQSAGAQYALGQSKPFVAGAGQAMMDLQNKFYKPLAFGSRSAINAFLAPERRAINQGYESGLTSLAMAPRGGGRVSAGGRMEMERQGRLSDLVFGARRAGAEGLQGSAQQLGALGTGLLGAGLAGGQQGVSLLQNQQGLAQRASERSDAQLGGIGQQLGGFLGQIFGGLKGGTAAGNKRMADLPILTDTWDPLGGQGKGWG